METFLRQLITQLDNNQRMGINSNYFNNIDEPLTKQSQQNNCTYNKICDVQSSTRTYVDAQSNLIYRLIFLKLSSHILIRNNYNILFAFINFISARRGETTITTLKSYNKQPKNEGNGCMPKHTIELISTIPKRQQRLRSIKKADKAHQAISIIAVEPNRDSNQRSVSTGTKDEECDDEGPSAFRQPSSRPTKCMTSDGEHCNNCDENCPYILQPDAGYEEIRLEFEEDGEVELQNNSLEHQREENQQESRQVDEEPGRVHEERVDDSGLELTANESVTLNGYISSNEETNRFEVPGGKLKESPTTLDILSCKSDEYRNYELWRLTTFSNWPQSSAFTATIMAHLGFYCPNVIPEDSLEDCAVCFSCGWSSSKWSSRETPLQRHKRQKSNCMLLDLSPEASSGNIPIDDTLELNVAAALKGRLLDQGDDDGKFTDIYEYKLHKELQRIKEARGLRHEVELHRLSTYLDPVWEEQHIEVSPLKLAKAGFFYLGSSDRVRCHFCENILREWEPGDDPFAEHMRHFPNCPFIRGLPTNNVPWDDKTFPVHSSDVARATRQQASSPPPERREQRPEEPTTLERVDPDRLTSMVAHRMKSPLCKRLIKNGYVPSILEEAIRNKIQYVTKDFATAKELVEDYKELQKAQRNTQVEPATCKICLDNRACVAFFPCGHMCCCYDCARDLKNCPICRAAIRKKEVLRGGRLV